MKAVAKSVFVRILFPAMFALLAACSGGSTSAGGDGSPSDTNTPTPAHINSFTASNETITANQSVTLSWDVTNATSVSITPGFANLSGNTGNVTVTPASTTTYTLQAVNAAGQSVSSSLTVTVSTPPPDAPQIGSFTASSTTITSGQSVTLSWSVTNATSRSISPGFASLGANSGSVTATPASTTTYTLQATNAAGQSVSSSLTVTVVPPPQIGSFTASSTTITSGQSVTLSWSVTNATSRSISPGFASLGANSGSVTATPASTTTYTLQATNAAGQSVSSSLTVTVVPPPQIGSFTASSTTITSGQSVTLSWSVTNATSRSISPGFASLGANSGSVTATPASTTTYTLQATNAAGQSVSSSLTVTVTANTPPQIASFTASPQTIQPGGTSTLSWNVTGATSLSVSPGDHDVSGDTSLQVSPTDTTTYTLTAIGTGGSTTRQVTVTVKNGTATGYIYDSSIFASESGLTEADWALLTEGRFFFARNSVGWNIVNGFANLAQSDAHYSVNNQYPFQLLANMPGPYLFNRSVGDNYAPYTKISAFDAQVRTDPAAGGQVHVAFMKFCFVDFNEATDVTALANAYIAEMNALESGFPATKFLWTTAPLTYQTDAANAIRNQFAERIRTYALANGKRVYDIAALEATNADGSRCTFALGGITYDRLCAAWQQPDDSHLNTDGGMRLARALGLALIDMRKQ